jgi:hypothetical protein
MENLKNRLITSSSKFAEYLLFIGLACLVIYYLMKSVFGSPLGIATIEKNTKVGNAKIDTVLIKQDVYQEENKESLENIENAQILFINLLNEQNRLLRQNNGELNKIKRILGNEGGKTINKTSVKPASGYGALDTFFSNRYQKLNNSGIKR